MADGTANQQITAEERPNPAPEPVRQERPVEPAKEAVAAQAPPAVSTPPRAAKPAKVRKSRLRPILFALLPVALVAGAYYYVTSGQILSTDNAYIQADMVGVSTDVAGTIASIEVHDNELVTKGQVLYRLKQDSYKTALAAAQAQLGTVRNQILTLQASYKQSEAQIAQAEADIPFYETAFKRQQDLSASAASSRATFDQAKHDLDSAKQKVIVAKAQAQAMLAQLGDAGQPVEQNPFFLQAQTGVDNAQRDLNDTVVRAPFDGVVTNVSSLQVGGYLQASQPGFSLVSNTHMWVGASPKETELTYVREGQPVTITVDTYPGLEWKGTVSSISPASGASFSLLPAQNTTGNWVKVVQRIPLRVRIDDMAGKPPLRVGMSVTAEINTGHAHGLPDFAQKLLALADKAQ